MTAVFVGFVRGERGALATTAASPFLILSRLQRAPQLSLKPEEVGGREESLAISGRYDIIQQVISEEASQCFSEALQMYFKPQKKKVLKGSNERQE